MRNEPIKIQADDRYAINLLADRMLEANQNGESKKYDCYSEALKAFLVNLLGSELYLECEKGRGFDCLETGHYALCVEMQVAEIQANKQREAKQKQIDKFGEFLTDKWRTNFEICTAMDLGSMEANDLLEEMYSNFEIVVRRIDGIYQYKLA